MTSNSGASARAASAAISSVEPLAERGAERELRGVEPPERDDVILAANLQHHPASGEVHQGVGVGLGLVRLPDAVDRPGRPEPDRGRRRAGRRGVPRRPPAPPAARAGSMGAASSAWSAAFIAHSSRATSGEIRVPGTRREASRGSRRRSPRTRTGRGRPADRLGCSGPPRSRRSADRRAGRPRDTSPRARPSGSRRRGSSRPGPARRGRGRRPRSGSRPGARPPGGRRSAKSA